MFAWLRELYEIRRENRMPHCDSCDILKVELANVRREKQELMSYILHPSTEASSKTAEEPKPMIQRHVPWRVRQQQLESQDRLEHERIMTEFKTKVNKPLTEELEKKMGIGNG